MLFRNKKEYDINVCKNRAKFHIYYGERNKSNIRDDIPYNYIDTNF